jgi:hypothetical protein
MLDGEQFGKEVVDLVRGYVDREFESLKAENAELKERIAALEAREPEKGEKGDPGEKGETGERGADGINGRDGAGLIDGFVSREGHLVCTLSDGTTRDFGEILGKDGRDGIDGKSAEELSDDDDLLVSAMLRKELGEGRLIELPEPVAAPLAKPTAQPPITLTIENHLPKRGVEKTVVTKHDERGRVLEFERREL